MDNLDSDPGGYTLEINSNSYTNSYKCFFCMCRNGNSIS